MKVPPYYVSKVALVKLIDVEHWPYCSGRSGVVQSVAGCETLQYSGHTVGCWAGGLRLSRGQVITWRSTVCYYRTGRCPFLERAGPTYIQVLIPSVAAQPRHVLWALPPGIKHVPDMIMPCKVVRLTLAKEIGPTNYSGL
jgi:hypothetical protein